MDMNRIPENGTRAAVRYWAQRTREAFRTVDAALKADEFGVAADWAAEAGGCGSEYQNAVDAYVATRRAGRDA
jgi:hypothetical protein